MYIKAWQFNQMFMCTVVVLLIFHCRLCLCQRLINSVLMMLPITYIASVSTYYGFYNRSGETKFKVNMLLG